MNIKKIFPYLFFTFLGMTLGDLMWHLRFLNPMLRKELVLLMQQGEHYFLLFFGINMFLTILIGLIIVYFNKSKIAGGEGK